MLDLCPAPSQPRRTQSPQPVTFDSLEARRLLAAANVFHETDLVSDGAAIPAVQHDTHLINGWGLAINQTNGAIWLGDNGMGVSTAYDDTGASVGPVVTIPHGSASTDSAPTGVVFNATNGFVISSGANTAKADYIFAG